MSIHDQVMQNVQGWPLSLRWTPHFHKVNNLGGMDAQTQSLINPPQHFRIRRTAENYELRDVRVRVRLGSQTKVRNGFLSSATQAEKDHLLRHEQGHFDIAGLLARDFVYTLLDLAMSTVVVDALIDSGNTAQQHQRFAEREILPKAREAWEETSRLWRIIDEPDGPGGMHRGLYERATEHGENHDGQNRWNRILDYAKTSRVSLSMTLSLFGEDPTNFATF